MNPEEIIEMVRKRCEAADVFFQSGESRSVEFDNNKLKRITSSQFTAAGLRVIADGRIGFASTTDLRKPENLVDMAIESAKFGEKAAFELPAGDAHYAIVSTWDPGVGNVTMEQMVDMGREALEMSRRKDEDYLFNAGVSISRGHERIINSHGLDLQCESSQMSAGVDIEEVNDGGILDVYEGKSWSRPFVSITDLAGDALEKMELGAVPARARSEKMPVIFTPKSVGNLLGPLLTALNGKLVQKGASVLAGRMGERVVDHQLSIYDDPSVDWAPGSTPFDGEGVPAVRMPLIEEGVVKNYLLDLQTAGLLGLKPTGSGHRSASSRPSPGTSNCMVSAGDMPYDEMVGSMKYGLIIDQTLGSGQSNTLAGEFSVNVALGFLVENGRIVGRVKDCMVAGNAYEVLSAIEATGSERQWRGSSYVPALCVGGLKLAVDA